MAEFGVRATELSGPSAAGSTPLQPVQPPSQRLDGNWLDFIRPVASMFTGTGEDRLQLAVNEYSQGLNTLNQLSITKQAGSTEIERKRRELWSSIQTKYADVPAAQLQQALNKQFDSAKQASGLDIEIDRAKDLRKREDDLVHEGVKLGLYDTNFANNSQTREIALNFMQTYNDTQRQLEATAKAYERTRKMVDDGQKDVQFQNSQVKLQLERDAQGFFQRNLSNYGDVVGQLTNTLVDSVKSGEMTGEDAILKLQMNANKFKAQGMTALAAAPEMQTKLTQYIDAMVDNAKYQMDPKNITEFTKERNGLQIAKIQQSMLASGQTGNMLGTLAALRNTVGDNALLGVTGLEVTNDVMTHFTKIGQSGTTSIVQAGNKEPQKVVYGAVNKATTTLISGASVDPQQDLQAVETNTKAIIGDFGRIRQGDPVKLTETINFLSGPSVKYLIEQNKLGREDLETMGQAYQSLYRDQLMTSVSKILNEKVIKGVVSSSSGEVSVAELIDFNVDDNGTVSVVTKLPENASKPMTYAQSRQLADLRYINKDLGSINTAIRMAAHSQGRTDYKKVFEENPSLFLPSFFPTKAAIEEAKANGYEYLGGNARNPRNLVKIRSSND